MLIGNNGNKIIPAVGRCVHCGGNNPCFMHTPMIFNMKDGSQKQFDNMPHVIGFIIGCIAELEAKMDIYMREVPSITIEHHK